MAHTTDIMRAAVAPTGHPHPLLAEQAREHVDLPQAAVDTISAALRTRLAGLTTDPRDLAEQLHQAIDEAHAVHLAAPEVTGFSLDECRSTSALCTALEAMSRAMTLTTDKALTARALRNMLAMVIDEARA